METEGHIVTRWIDNGVHWDAPEFRTPERVSLLTDTVRRIHALPSNGAALSPFDRVARFADKARKLGETLPPEINACMTALERGRERQRADTSPWLAFCHNDLVWVNYLYRSHDDTLRVLDREFSGMGDIYYDLAAIVYTHDSEGAIPDNLENLMLERYFGEPTDFVVDNPGRQPSLPDRGNQVFPFHTHRPGHFEVEHLG
ncbi:MAG: phosphotransferase [Spirochaetales bacterium]